jgi:hypothetical protein
MAIHIYQIYYDQASKQALDPGFIPLDNSNTERPDWYEFWPIRKFLKENQLQEDSWYGFLSPKFAGKTGFNSKTIKELITQYDRVMDVALFSSTWDFIAYYKNCFEQGEVWHENITQVAQMFFNVVGYEVNCAELVNHTQNSVTSNYVIAKPVYWRRWLDLADKLFAVSESNTPLGNILSGQTTYGPKLLPFKVFIQERLAPVLLANEKFKVLSPDQSQFRPLFSHLFHENLRTRRTLQTCDLLKERYCATGDRQYLDTYSKLKAEIPIKPTRFR